MEEDISKNYIDALGQVYTEYFFRYQDSTLVIINTSNIDFVHNENDFPDFPDFRKMLILGIFLWDLGSGRVCNGLEMAVGFKWTDSQLISRHLGPFSRISRISMILLLFLAV